jgi:hypothetical protein
LENVHESGRDRSGGHPACGPEKVEKKQAQENRKVSIMKINHRSSIVMMAVIASGLGFRAQAQSNLVNLYDWTPETQYGFTPDQGISIGSFDSASFYGQYSVNGRGNRNDIIHPILTVNLDTTPGTTYQISYTLEMSNLSRFQTPGSLSFGNDPSSFLFYFPSSPLDGDQTSIFDYTRTAVASTTTMTFYVGFIDTGDLLCLSDFSVTALSPVTPVPEVSTASLLVLGGGVWLLAAVRRRTFEPRQLH